MKLLLHTLATLWLVLALGTAEADTLTFTYDGNGNRTWNGIADEYDTTVFPKENRHYDYDDANRLSRILYKNNGGDCPLTELHYNYQGDLARKIEYDSSCAWTVVRKTYYLSDENGIYRRLEKDVAGNILKDELRWLANGELVATKDRSNPARYYLPDHLAGVYAVLDDQGNLIERLRYEPYGKPRQFSSQTYTYAGKEWDRENALSDFGHRSLHPGTFQFTQPDTRCPFPLTLGGKTYSNCGTGLTPIGLARSQNPYAYGRNNPMTYVDHNGDFAIISSAVWGVNGAPKAYDGGTFRRITHGLVSAARWSADTISNVYNPVRKEAPQLLTKSERLVGNTARVVSKAGAAVDLVTGIDSTSSRARTLDADSSIPSEDKTALKILWAIEIFAPSKYLTPGSKALLEKHGASKYGEYMSRRNNALKAIVNAPGTDIDPVAVDAYMKKFGH